MSLVGNTNEKLYQAKLLLAMHDSSSPRAAQHALLDAAVFCMHTGLLSFLREIAAAHRLKPVFYPNVDALAAELVGHGITDSSVTSLQQAAFPSQWLGQLLSWYRAALEGVESREHSHDHAGHTIAVFDAALDSDKRLVSDVIAATDVLDKLRGFVEVQRAQLIEW